jgi:hypothetical protein
LKAWSGLANIASGGDAIDGNRGQELTDSTVYDLTVDYIPGGFDAEVTYNALALDLGYHF